MRDGGEQPEGRAGRVCGRLMVALLVTISLLVVLEGVALVWHDHPPDMFGWLNHGLTYGMLVLLVALVLLLWRSMRAIERSARVAERRWRDAADALPVMLWMADPSGRLVFFNKAFRRYLGVPADHGFPIEWLKAVHPEDREIAMSCSFESERARGVEVIYRMRRADGVYRRLRDTAGPLSDARGEPIGKVGATLDISDQLDHERELAEHREHLNEAQRVARVGSFEYDFETMMLTYSREFGRMCGLPEGMQRMDVREFRRWCFRPEDIEGSERRMEEIRLGRRDPDGEHELLVGGTLRHVYRRAKVRRDETGRAVTLFGTMQDITDRRKAELELERHAQSQRLLLQELDHRVKNSLGGLLTLVDLCAEREATKEGLAGSIRGRVRAMADVHALLSESRFEPIELGRLIRGLIPPGVPGEIALSGPPVGIPPRQATPMGVVLHELFSNAVKHGALSHEGGSISVDWEEATFPCCPEAHGLRVRWRERGFSATAGDAEGLGTALMRGFASSELRGSIDLVYGPEGVDHELRARLDSAADDALENGSADVVGREEGGAHATSGVGVIE